jgi:hypothetical protein
MPIVGAGEEDRGAVADIVTASPAAADTVTQAMSTPRTNLMAISNLDVIPTGRYPVGRVFHSYR